MNNRIAIIRREYRVDGGAEQAVNTFLKAYKTLGFHVTLVCEKWDAQFDYVDSIVTLDVSGVGRLSRLRSFTQSAEAWIRANPDILVQSHEWVDGADILRLGDGLHSYWFRILQSSRSIISILLLRLSRFHRFKIRQEKHCLRAGRLKKIIVNSEFVRSQLDEQYPQVSEKVITIYNVCRDFDQLRALPIRSRSVSKKSTLGFVGSGWERKGLRLLLKAFAQLVGDFDLRVYGNDKSANSFKSFAKQLGVIEKINWCGVRDNTASIYSEIDCVVIPSLYDPYPNVAIEAIVAGVQVIASSETGVSDHEQNQAIQIFKSGSVEDLVNKIDGVGRMNEAVQFERNKLSPCFTESNMQLTLSNMLNKLQ